MGQVVEVMVAGKEMQTVFNHERGNPDIVGGNGRTLLTQLAKELGIVSRCGLASVENRCPGPIEKTPQNAFVFAGVRAALGTIEPRTRCQAAAPTFPLLFPTD